MNYFGYRGLVLPITPNNVTTNTKTKTKTNKK